MKMNFGNILKNALLFLRARTKIGGLEISDTALRFAYLKNGTLQVAGFRLPPGTMENGEVKNREQFVEALKSIRGRLPADFPRRSSVSAVITLSSVRIYAKALTLPLMKKENLEEAIQLNIKMISPLELSQTYSGWQFIDENQSESRIEILTAFAKKTLVDEISACLKEAGFSPIAMESGALSLARLLRERAAGFEPDKFYLLASIDDRGFQFLIIRRGQLYFEYFNSWRDIQGDAKQISWQDFEAAVKRNLHQVLTFYGTHWPEPITQVFLLTNSFGEEVSKIIKENFSLAVRELKSKFEEPVGREWFEAIGSALRAETPRSKDRDINLFGVTVQEEFRRRQVIEFLKFWEVLAPSSLGVLLVVFALGYSFLANVRNSLESQSSFLTVGKQNQEIDSFKSRIEEFNRSVSLISFVQSSLKPKAALIEAIGSLVNSEGITIEGLSLKPDGRSVILTGEVKSQEKLLNFKNALAANQSFTSVKLPLPDIQPRNGGLSFKINFELNQQVLVP